MANYGHHLRDISVPKPNKALAEVMNGPGVNLLLYMLGEEAVALYRAKVAKRSGRLALSAEATVVTGGHKYDRQVAKVTVGGMQAVAPLPWKGAPFYYGVLHEHGSPRRPDDFPAAKDLREVLATM